MAGACQYQAITWTIADFISKVMWYLPEGNFKGLAKDINPQNVVEDNSFQI